MVWLDPAVGILGALMIARWSYALLHDTGRILLDGAVDDAVLDLVRTRIEAEGDNKVTDLHMWHVGPDRYAAIVAVVAHSPKPPDHYKELLADIEGLSHVSVEVQQCCDPAAQTGGKE